MNQIFNQLVRRVPDPCAVLEVSLDSSPSQVNRAFRRLAKLKHPDLNKSPSAKEEFQILRDAYQLLKNKEFKELVSQLYIKKASRDALNSKKSQLLKREAQAQKKSASDPLVLLRQKNAHERLVREQQERQQLEMQRQRLRSQMRESESYRLISCVRLQYNSKQNKYDNFIVHEIFEKVGPLKSVQISENTIQLIFMRHQDALKLFQLRHRFPEFSFQQLESQQKLEQIRKLYKVQSSERQVRVSSQNIGRLVSRLNLGSQSETRV